MTGVSTFRMHYETRTERVSSYPDSLDGPCQDPVIGHLFDDVQDWEAHIARITTFWSSVALMSGRYHGNPMAPHLKLPLEPPHFARWLTLFEQTVRDLCSEAGGDLLLEKARRIAQSLQFGVEAKRGVLPMRQRTA